MNTFTKRLALVMGLLFTALLCLGIVYIDNVKHYWQFSGGFVRLVVMTNAQAVMTVDTNTLRVGFNTNNIARSFVVKGQTPPTNLTANGTSASTTGLILLEGGDGGQSAVTATATGGAAGGVTITGGAGGGAGAATTNATGGTGGALTFVAGEGGRASTGAATNAATGGTGGAAALRAGDGGPNTLSATNVAGGNGGNLNLSSGTGGSVGGGWARKGGNGGQLNLTAGNGANSLGTNSGNGGTYAMTAGSAGTVTAGPGDAGLAGTFTITAGNSAVVTGGGNPTPGGEVMITAGNGGTGATNSDGGHTFIAGGAPGSGAVPGNVVLARTSAGVSRGAGVQIGPLITGGSATVTNMLGIAVDLDFPSTVAGAFSELPVTISGVTSNNFATSLSTPWESAQTGGLFGCFNSNGVCYVRFINNQLVSAIDPAPGNFVIVGFRIR